MIQLKLIAHTWYRVLLACQNHWPFDGATSFQASRLASATRWSKLLESINQQNQRAKVSHGFYYFHIADGHNPRCNVDAFPCSVSRDFPLFFPRRSAKESLCVSHTRRPFSHLGSISFPIKPAKNREATNQPLIQAMLTRAKLNGHVCVG